MHSDAPAVQGQEATGSGGADFLVHPSERVSRCSGIPAVESGVVRAVIVVVVQREAQAELGRAGGVDVRKTGAAQSRTVPTAGGRSAKRGNRRPARSRLEITNLQADGGAEEGLADVHPQAAMRDKWIRAHLALRLDLERSVGDDLRIPPTGSIEMQNSAILFVGRIIAQVEERRQAV